MVAKMIVIIMKSDIIVEKRCVTIDQKARTKLIARNKRMRWRRRALSDSSVRLPVETPFTMERSGLDMTSMKFSGYTSAALAPIVYFKGLFFCLR